MKSSTGEAIAFRDVARDACAAMTIGTESLELMAAHAPRIVLTSALCVHRHPIVRMNLTRTNPSVMTIGAFVFRVATTAEGAVVRGDGLVTLDEIRGVCRVVHPLWWNKFARGERREHAAVVARGVTRDALTLGLTLRSAAHVVAGEASSHSRKLTTRCQLEFADLAMTLSALDVAIDVFLVRENKVRVWKNHLCDGAIGARFFTQVAVDALTVGVCPRFHGLQI
jgi:hypothetical protein